MNRLLPLLFIGCQVPSSPCDYSIMEPMILFLHPGHVEVLKDALTAFANQEDSQGDPCGVSPICDELWSRLDGLSLISPHRIEAIEVMKTMGMVRYKNRPQG